MGVSRDHRIPNSASHHFSKIHFFEKHTKKNHCLDMFFFISQNLYCFKNSWAIIPMTCCCFFSLVKCVDLRTVRKVFNSLTLFSIFWTEWLRCVCFVCVRYEQEWLTWWVVLPIDFTQCYRSGKAVSLVKQSLPVMKLKTLLLYSGLM